MSTDVGATSGIKRKSVACEYCGKQFVGNITKENLKIHQQSKGCKEHQVSHVQLSHPQHTISPEELKAYAMSRSEFDAVLKKGGFKPEAVRARIKGAAEELITTGEQHAKFWSYILKD